MKLQSFMMKLITSTKFLLSIILLLMSSFPPQAKVLVFTYSYNKPEFIELQHKTLQKFLIDDYELIVINDASNSQMVKRISNTCKEYNLKCITIPQEIHERPYLNRPLGGRPFFLGDNQSPCVRNCNVVQYSLDTIGFNYSGIVALFDSDLFLIKEFSITEYLSKYAIAGFDRSKGCITPYDKHNFLWIGLIFLNFDIMPQKNAFNINCGFINKVGLDSGAYTHYYLPQAPVTYIERTRVESYICHNCHNNKEYRCSHNTEILQSKGFSPYSIQLIQDTPIDWGSGSKELGMHNGRNIEFYLNDTFVHYQGASNYASLSAQGIDMNEFHNDKTKAFQSFINNILY